MPWPAIFLRDTIITDLLKALRAVIITFDYVIIITLAVITPTQASPAHPPIVDLILVDLVVRLNRILQLRRMMLRRMILLFLFLFKLELLLLEIEEHVHIAKAKQSRKTVI